MSQLRSSRIVSMFSPGSLRSPGAGGCDARYTGGAGRVGGVEKNGCCRLIIKGTHEPCNAVQIRLLILGASPPGTISGKSCSAVHGRKRPRLTKCPASGRMGVLSRAPTDRIDGSCLFKLYCMKRASATFGNNTSPLCENLLNLAVKLKSNGTTCSNSRAPECG